MIYYFTGEYTEKKDELTTMMYDFLATHRRNWRQKVFIVDRKTTEDVDVYSVLKFMAHNECDVVVNLECGLDIHPNWVVYIDVVTERKSVKTMFSNIITQLRVKNQI